MSYFRFRNWSHLVWVRKSQFGWLAQQHICEEKEIIGYLPTILQYRKSVVSTNIWRHKHKFNVVLHYKWAFSESRNSNKYDFQLGSDMVWIHISHKITFNDDRCKFHNWSFEREKSRSREEMGNRLDEFIFI